jgi:hypothetical protein
VCVLAFSNFAKMVAASVNTAAGAAIKQQLTSEHENVCKDVEKCGTQNEQANEREREKEMSKINEIIAK